jgi:hypothetical protein
VVRSSSDANPTLGRAAATAPLDPFGLTARDGNRSGWSDGGSLRHTGRRFFDRRSLLSKPKNHRQRHCLDCSHQVLLARSFPTNPSIRMRDSASIGFRPNVAFRPILPLGQIYNLYRFDKDNLEMRNLNLDRLRTLVEVIELGSFSAAARRLNPEWCWAPMPFDSARSRYAHHIRNGVR